MVAFANMPVFPSDTAMRTTNQSVQFLKFSRGEPLAIEASDRRQGEDPLRKQRLVAKADAQRIVTLRDPR
jgi:hypothetical protein